MLGFEFETSLFKESRYPVTRIQINWQTKVNPAFSQILKPQDIKPFPVLWHEDSNGRRQQARERPQLSGTLSGHVLGEAAHRLVKNSLQIKSNNTVRLLETPCRNAAQGINKPRPAGPLGYEGGFMEDKEYYRSSTYNPPSWDMQGFSNSRPFQFASDFQGCSQNFRMQKSKFQDHVNISTGLPNLTIEEGPRFQSHPRMPNAQYWPNHQQRIQNAGPPPPLPPINWIGKQTRGYMDGSHIQVPTNWTGRQPTRGSEGGFGRQEISTRSMYDKQQQMSKVYRVKSQTQEPTNSSNQQ